MKRWVKIVVLILALVILLAAGAALYKHFITDSIMDKGGMENPDPGSGADTTGDGAEGGDNDAANPGIKKTSGSP